MTLLIDRELAVPAPERSAPPVHSPRSPESRPRRRLTVLMTALVATATTAGAAAFLARGHATHTRATTPAWELAATAEILGVPTTSLTGTLVTDVATPYGARRQVLVPDRALVQIDAVTREINQIVYSDRLGRATGTLLPRERALATATAFATARYAGLGDLVQRSVEVLDHDAFTEFRVEWQARHGDAWLPSGVTVGVNARTGTVAYYWSTRLAPSVPLTPAVSATAATAAARRLAPHATSHSEPELDVVVLGDGQQQLVWVVVATPPHGKGAHVAITDRIWVDANTGTARVGAST